MWEEIEEDQDGVLVVNTEEEELENFRRRRAKASDVVNQANIRKGLIRWLLHPESLPCSQRTRALRVRVDGIACAGMWS